MTNLERAAALAAEQGLFFIEAYKGWDIYRAYGVEVAALPHEMDVVQFSIVLEAGGFPTSLHVGGDVPMALLKGISHHGSTHDAIDRWEAAREAMPASAFFGVEVEAL